MLAKQTSGPGLLVVISGPSGVGKTTIVRALPERIDAVNSVSATTRKQRPGEANGVDYYFVDTTRFEQMRDSGEFLEYAQVFDRDWYGTPRGPVEERLEAGRIIVLEIDVQGGLQVKEAMPDALMLFIKPPSNETLLERLRGRGKDDEETIQHRYSKACREIELAEESGKYDAFVVNSDLEESIDEVCRMINERRATATVE